MRFIRGLLLAFIAAGLLFASLQALANMAPVKVITKFIGGVGGGGVAPDHPHQSIRLDSEEIAIRLKRSGYEVDAVFNLFNTGETTTEWTGFPNWAASSTDSYPTFMRFEGMVNAEPIKFEEERDLSGVKMSSASLWAQQKSTKLTPLKQDRRWLVAEVTFPGHAKTTIRVRYEARYSGYYHEASYIYGTGSLWKGNIGKSVFMVDSTEVGGTGYISTRFENGLEPVLVSEDVKPELREISLSTLRYEITDFKPHLEASLKVTLNKSLRVRKVDGRLFPPFRPVHGPIPMAPPPPLPVRVKK